MTTPNQNYLLDSIQEIHTEIAKILADPACPASITRALGRLQDWLGQHDPEEVYRCKASLMETVRQYGREARELQWLMAN